MSEQPRRPIIVAHRGLHHVHPENSLAAFRAAWEAGIEWCECDVQLSRDGQWIVIHDGTLDRTTTSAGPVASLAAEELRRLRLKGPDGSATDEQLPPLAELLDVMGRCNALLLEIKPRIELAALRTLLEMLADRRVRVQSFHRSLAESSQRRVEWLTDKPLDLRGLPDCTGINIRHDLLDAEVLASLRDSRYAVGVWTANAERDLSRAIDLGVDMIITDEPLLARDLLNGGG